MKKLCQKVSRFIATALIATIIAPMIVPIASAVNDSCHVNAVSILCDDAEMVIPGESIDLEINGTVETYPASLLYENTIYISVPILLELGVRFSFPDDSNSKVMEISRENYLGPILSRREESFSDPIDSDLLFNVYAITINEEQIAQIGENLTYLDNSYPSSIVYNNYPFFPAQYILQELDFDTVWDEDNLSFLISQGDYKNIGVSNFSRSNHYDTNQYTDVSSDAWYAETVKSAFEYGLMLGTGSKFNPTGNMSIAEVITIASRLHSTYYDNNYEFLDSTPWYQAYVDYAIDHELISKPYSDYSVPILRGEFAIIMANVFPLESINEIEEDSIPDVAVENEYYDSVYKLYRAGITSGTDSEGTFNPDKKITRAEVSVVLSNMVNEKERKEFTLKAPIYPESVKITQAALFVPLGGARAFSVQISPYYANRGTTISWSSSDDSVATVDSQGIVTGKGMGIAKITATTANGKSATYSVTVASIELFDIIFAEDAVDKLYSKLKFPDTLQLFNIWASNVFVDSNGSHILCISIYYGAMNMLGLLRRGEYQAYYNLDTGLLSVDGFEDKLSSHKFDREVNIKDVLS